MSDKQDDSRSEKRRGRIGPARLTLNADGTVEMNEAVTLGVGVGMSVEAEVVKAVKLTAGIGEGKGSGLPPEVNTGRLDSQLGEVVAHLEGVVGTGDLVAGESTVVGVGDVAPGTSSMHIEGHAPTVSITPAWTGLPDLEQDNARIVRSEFLGDDLPLWLAFNANDNDRSVHFDIAATELDARRGAARRGLEWEAGGLQQALDQFRASLDANTAARDRLTAALSQNTLAQELLAATTQEAVKELRLFRERHVSSNQLPNTPFVDQVRSWLDLYIKTVEVGKVTVQAVAWLVWAVLGIAALLGGVADAIVSRILDLLHLGLALASMLGG